MRWLADACRRRTRTTSMQAAVGLHTGRYWASDLAQECFVGRHMRLAMGLGVTGLVVLAAGWPALTWALLARPRDWCLGVSCQLAAYYREDYMTG